MEAVINPELKIAFYLLTAMFGVLALYMLIKGDFFYFVLLLAGVIVSLLATKEKTHTAPKQKPRDPVISIKGF